jgi:hypothetical protein
MMREYDLTSSYEPKATSEPPVARFPSNGKRGWGAVSALMGAVIVLSGCAATSSPSATATATSPSAAAGHGTPAGPLAGRGSNARSGPAAGGSSGTVVSVSNSGFTLSTSTGQKVTVKETSSTKYLKGMSSASAGAITAGVPVLVLGTTSGTTITATQVIAQPAGGGSAASTAAQVVPFQRGARSAAKQVGHIPANYSEGSGTIVSGTTADNATKAALAAYPGGVVDRVVRLSDGEYEAHNIGVSWPHHVFLDQGFKVVGAG